MKLYIVKEKYVTNPVQYVCFSLKALKELESMGTNVNIIKIIESKDFSKNDYPNEDFYYFFVDTKDAKYLLNVDKILDKTITIPKNK